MSSVAPIIITGSITYNHTINETAVASLKIDLCRNNNVDHIGTTLLLYCGHCWDSLNKRYDGSLYSFLSIPLRTQTMSPEEEHERWISTFDSICIYVRMFDSSNILNVIQRDPS